MSSIDRRLAKLEGASSQEIIPIWTDNPDDVPAEVDEMIREGKITEANRRRCVHWTNAKCEPGEHERALDRLLALQGTAAHDVA